MPTDSGKNALLGFVIALYRGQTAVERDTIGFLQDYGLTLPQFGVLEVLYHKGPLCIRDILERTLSTSGNMTVVIRNLEKEGYVNRERDPEDKRIHRIGLSQKGSQLIARAFPAHVERLHRLLGHLTPEEIKSMTVLLKKVQGK